MIHNKKKAERLSNLCYNRGLDRAQVRDLSGAVDLLKKSLQFNKRNIQARNLLGLVYFETGEAVSALSEWVISKNLQPQDNLANDYIEKLRNNQSKLAQINQTIKNYNVSLRNCRRGDEDVAAITLKKVIAQNPRFIKAYHLLSLIYIQSGRYTRARKLLRKALRIDSTNATSLRYMREIDERTGVSEKEKEKEARRAKRRLEEEPITAGGFRESRPALGLFNILLGAAIGVFVAWFLIAPAVRHSVSRSSDEKIVEYSKQMAAQEKTIAELEGEAEKTQETVASANEQIEAANVKASAYENLLKAYRAYEEGSFSEAQESFESIDSAQLSTDAKAVYDSMFENVKATMFERYKVDGMNAFDYERWDEAIDLLIKAREINGEDYTVLVYLATAYYNAENYAESTKVFQEIVDQFPDTRRASNAQNYIDQMAQYVGSDSGQDTETEEETETSGGGDLQAEAVEDE